jgi:hypothetical protein
LDESSELESLPWVSRNATADAFDFEAAMADLLANMEETMK